MNKYVIIRKAGRKSYFSYLLTFFIFNTFSLRCCIAKESYIFIILAKLIFGNFGKWPRVWIAARKILKIILWTLSKDLERINKAANECSRYVLFKRLQEYNINALNFLFWWLRRLREWNWNTGEYPKTSWQYIRESIIRLISCLWMKVLLHCSINVWQYNNWKYSYVKWKKKLWKMFKSISLSLSICSGIKNLLT